MDWWHYWCLANGYEFRMFRGEYPYNRDAVLVDWQDERYVDDVPLRKGDALLISLPFSGTGTKHGRMEETPRLSVMQMIFQYLLIWHGLELVMESKLT